MNMYIVKLIMVDISNDHYKSLPLLVGRMQPSNHMLRFKWTNAYALFNHMSFEMHLEIEATVLVSSFSLF